ncbi:MAG: hypothetical protein ACRD2W_01520 [Acidimicrobiales bacterium]
MSGSAEAISFGGGAPAVAIRAGRDATGEDLLDALQLPVPKGTVVVSGSTAALAPEVERRIRSLIVDGIGRVVAEAGLTVVTGATDAGIFAVVGTALDAHEASVVGVAPLQLVTWPGREDEGDDPLSLTPLEPHHTHFVLVDGEDWGDETAALIELTRALDARGPAVAVLFGGGSISRCEAVAHVDAGLRLVVVAGSGRLANTLADAAEAPDACGDSELADLVRDGKVTIFPATGGPVEFAALLRDLLAATT